jgi:hypothetical protein
MCIRPAGPVLVDPSVGRRCGLLEAQLRHAERREFFGGHLQARISGPIGRDVITDKGQLASL